MAKKQPKPKKNGRAIYRTIGHVARPLAFALRIGAFVLLCIAAVALICMLIVSLMRVEPETLTVAPYLHAETGSGGNTVFHVSLGNGVRMTVPAERVTESAVKTALYAGLVQLCLGCLVLFPICRFVSLLLSNLAAGQYGDKRNPDMICYCAMTLLCGAPVLSAVSGWFNYLLQKAFSGGGVMLSYVFHLDWYAIFAGALLLVGGFVYGCENARLPAPAELPVGPEGEN